MRESTATIERLAALVDRELELDIGRLVSRRPLLGGSLATVCCSLG